jgi:hypothetical protein
MRIDTGPTHWDEIHVIGDISALRSLERWLTSERDAQVELRSLPPRSLEAQESGHKPGTGRNGF